MYAGSSSVEVEVSEVAVCHLALVTGSFVSLTHNGMCDFQLRGNFFSGQNDPREALRLHSGSTAKLLAKDWKYLVEGGSHDWSSVHDDKASCASDLKYPANGVSTQRHVAPMLHHVKSGQGGQALESFEGMRKHGSQLKPSTYVAALKACSSLRDLESAKRVHAELVENGFESIVFVGNVLMSVYAKCGSMVDARSVFEKMHQRSVVSWNTIISAYAQVEEGEVALQMFARMQQEGVEPNHRSFVSALRACSSLEALVEGSELGVVKNRCLGQVRAIHSQAMKFGVDLDAFVGTTMVNLYAKCGSLVDARHAFEKMAERNVASWTAIISAYAQMGDGNEALRLYSRMQQEGVVPDARAFVGALKACSSLAALEEESQIGEILVKRHSLEQVRAIDSDIMKVQFESNLFVATMLVDVYVKCGSLMDARRVFENMPRRDVVSWTALILGYALMEDCAEALQLYARMKEEGIMPNQRTFVAALKACGGVAGLEKGKEIHAQIWSAGVYATNPHVTSSLIDMYSRCGSMGDAQRVFDGLPTRNIVTWSALIAGYSRLGESECVFQLFEMMRQAGVQPEEVTLLSVLTACSHAGMVDKGQSYFVAMSRDFSIVPAIEHYTCMIDMLGRAGRLEEAMTLASTMPVKPSGVVWRTLMSACRKWGNVDLGRRAFERAVKLNKFDAASYVMMQNIYATANMLEERKEIQDMRPETRSLKKPGQSCWTDTSGNVYSFYVGDRERPENVQIYLHLDGVLLEIRKHACEDAHLNSLLGGSNDEGDALSG